MMSKSEFPSFISSIHSNSPPTVQNQSGLTGLEVGDLDIIHAELKNCLSRTQEETEASKRQLASLNIHVVPENLQHDLESIAEFQLTLKIDEFDELGSALSVADIVLKKVEQASVQRELKRDSRLLNDHKKQLNHCLKILQRDAKLYKEQQVAKEDTNARLKAKNLILEPELDEVMKTLEQVDFDDDVINSYVEQIKTLNEQETELNHQIESESSYLKQFSGLPPSLTEAAKKISEQEEKLHELELKSRSRL